MSVAPAEFGFVAACIRLTLDIDVDVTLAGGRAISMGVKTSRTWQRSARSRQLRNVSKTPLEVTAACAFLRLRRWLISDRNDIRVGASLRRGSFQLSVLPARMQVV